VLLTFWVFAGNDHARRFYEAMGCGRVQIRAWRWVACCGWLRLIAELTDPAPRFRSLPLTGLRSASVVRIPGDCRRNG
jgi:hypothetical protein